MTTQPEALWMADELEANGIDNLFQHDVAAELRRLHAENESLEKANRLLQQHCTTAWNRGYTMGLSANRDTVKQALDAVKKDAWGNTQLTETLMAAEEENEALRADAERYRWIRIGNDENQVMNYLQGLEDWVPWSTPEDVDAAIDAARSKKYK